MQADNKERKGKVMARFISYCEYCYEISIDSIESWSDFGMHKNAGKRIDRLL